jgi:UPF0042 nucleotide-binding protein
MFIEARSEVIIRRYKETRRRHPLALDGESLERAVARERELLEAVRARAAWVIDTTLIMASGALRDHIAGLLSMQTRDTLLVSVVSFGFKYGLPQESDLVFDVRFLRNPYHVEELRPMSGLDPLVRSYVMSWPQTGAFLRMLTDMVGFLLPEYAKEGKTNVVAAVGCTGGRHRSVTVAQYLYEFLRGKKYKATVYHRDAEKFGVR